MTQAFTLTIAGSVATTLSLLLLLLRQRTFNRQVCTRLRRVPDLRPVVSVALIAGTAAVAVLCFAALGHLDSADKAEVSATGTIETGSIDDDRKAEALASLRAYADRIAAKREAIDGLSKAPDDTTNSKAKDVPDVDTMIARLASRLDAEPGDVKGWKMLGWSYLNTGRPMEALKAYETALKLAPEDSEIRQALASMSPQGSAAAEAAPSSKSPPDGASARGSEDADFKAAESLSVEERATMIRSMVERLAGRLQIAPNDEDGWVRLMRARMVLGEKDAAKAAFDKALETFAADQSAKDRLAASAHELGVESH